MPWIQKEDGSKEYKLSMYTKEELPTWDEIYNEWYKSGHIIYDPNDVHDQVIDLYWKIPHKVYLLLTICNQFNKMIYEDGYKDQIIKMISDNINHMRLSTNYTGNGLFKIVDLLFLVHSDEDCISIFNSNDEELQVKLANRMGCSIEEFLKITNSVIKEAPPIYSIKMPSGHINPFIFDTKFRCYIDQELEFHRKLGITLFITTERTGGQYKNGPVFFVNPFSSGTEDSCYRDIIDLMITPYKDYFENGVGWKDDHGSLISGDSKSSAACYTGFDSAK